MIGYQRLWRIASNILERKPAGQVEPGTREVLLALELEASNIVSDELG
jgi:hypothetical protein